MTKSELFEKYRVWAEKNRWYLTPNDLDDAIQVFSFNSGRTEDTFSGTGVYTITAQNKGKIHMFIFSMRTTWLEDDCDMFDAHELQEVNVEYRCIIAF